MEMEAGTISVANEWYLQAESDGVIRIKDLLVGDGTNLSLLKTSSSGNVFAENSDLIGDITNNNGGVGSLSLSLLPQSTWTGAIMSSSTGDIDVDLDDSKWDVTDDSKLTSLTLKDSDVDLRNVVPGNFNTLTVGQQYTSNNSNVYLNTELGSDLSPTDRIVIDGGSATGNTVLSISNVGGLGGLTAGNGILVVDAINGATTDPAAFTLGSRVVVGSYEYSLYRGSLDATAPESWFLRSRLVPQSIPVLPMPLIAVLALMMVACARSGFRHCAEK